MLCTDSCVCIDDEQLNLMNDAEEETSQTGPVELTEADLEQVVGGRGVCSQSVCCNGASRNIVCC